MNDHSSPLICLHFCLSPQLDNEERRREIREAEVTFREEGILFCVTSADEGLLHAEGRKTAGTEGEDSDCPVLYVTDSGTFFRTLITYGCKAVGYLHNGNRSEQFDGAGYLIEEPQNVDPDSYLKIWQRLSGIPWIIVTTRRLVIREVTENDTDALYRLYDDADARRFLPELPSDRDSERTILKVYAEKVYRFFGYGMWALCDRKTGEVIGRAGFEPYLGDSDYIEMGYLIREDRRHQGLCTEALQAILRFADEELMLPAIAIRTDRDNAASIAVAESMGFQEKSGIQPAGIKYFVRTGKE